MSNGQKANNHNNSLNKGVQKWLYFVLKMPYCGFFFLYLWPIFDGSAHSYSLPVPPFDATIIVNDQRKFIRHCMSQFFRFIFVVVVVSYSLWEKGKESGRKKS